MASYLILVPTLWAVIAGDLEAGGCGLQSVPSTQLAKGEVVVAGQLPWNVYIYGTGDEVAGTLISPKHVVTWARSFSIGSSNLPRPTSDFRITAGQLVRYSSPAEEPHSQTRGVQSVVFHPQYEGFNGAHDIALIVAKTSFVITPAVNVACVDWTGLFLAPTTSDVIIVAAWKRGANDTAHRVTAAQLYTPVARLQCRERAWPNKRNQIKEDMFCCVNTNNVTCGGFDGAGLTVERATSGGARYYLTGVASVELSLTNSDSGCDYDRLHGYTDVTSHVSWLQQHVSPPT